MSIENFVAPAVGDRVYFTHKPDGEVHRGQVERVFQNKLGYIVVTIKDETRGGAFRSFRRKDCGVFEKC
jgi:hypothetical protein